MTWERITVRVPREDLEAIDTLVEDGTHPHRSAAIRTGIRRMTGTRPPVLTDGGTASQVTVTDVERADDRLQTTETFDIDGEPIERVTDVRFNDDGSVTLTQEDQTFELVTLSGAVLAEFLADAADDRDAEVDRLRERVAEWSCDRCGDRKATCSKGGEDLCNECAFGGSE